MVVEVVAPCLGRDLGIDLEDGLRAVRADGQIRELVVSNHDVLCPSGLVPEVGVAADTDSGHLRGEITVLHKHVAIGREQKASGPVVANGAVPNRDIRASGDVLKGYVCRIRDSAKIEIGLYDVGLEVGLVDAPDPAGADRTKIGLVHKADHVTLVGELVPHLLEMAEMSP